MNDELSEKELEKVLGGTTHEIGEESFSELEADKYENMTEEEFDKELATNPETKGINNLLTKIADFEEFNNTKPDTLENNELGKMLNENSSNSEKNTVVTQKK